MNNKIRIEMDAKKHAEIGYNKLCCGTSDIIIQAETSYVAGATAELNRVNILEAKLKIAVESLEEIANRNCWCDDKNICLAHNALAKIES